MTLSARLALLVALLASLYAGGAPRPAAAQPDAHPVRIVILPIVVHSAAPDTRYVSHGLSDMLSARLEQTGHVEIVQVEEAEAATTQLGEALRHGKEQGGDFVVFGSFTQFGEGASLDVHCIPAAVNSEAEAAAARRIFIQSGAIGEIIPKLDKIVDRVAIYAHVVPDPGTPAAEEGGPAPPAADSATLRDLTERLEALEEAVFGGGASAAVSRDAAEAPES